MKLLKHTIEITPDELFELQWSVEQNIINDVEKRMEKNKDISLADMLSEVKTEIDLLDSLNIIDGSTPSECSFSEECYSGRCLVEQLHKKLYKKVPKTKTKKK